MPPPKEETSDVLPPLANQALATLWILLLGGRWLLIPWLMSNQYPFITPAIREDLDQHILFPCYLVLLIITLTVLALRIARRARNPVPPDFTPETVQPTHAESSETSRTLNRSSDFRQEQRTRD